MKQSKAYLKISNIAYKQAIETLLNERFENKIDFFWENNLAKIIAYDCDNFSYSLKQAINIMISDFFTSISVIIVPKFHDLFVKYFDKINNTVISAFDIFIMNINDEQIKNDSRLLLENIKKEYIETANVFLNCNMNACQAAKELYLHRNSFNYRLNQFYYTSEMDVKDFDTAVFLKLIFSLLS